MSTAALTRTQAPGWKLAKDYRDALIVDWDGTLRRFEHIEVLGLAGNSIGRKMLSWLSSSRRIAVRLSEPLSYQLEELKQVLADCINAHGLMNFAEEDEKLPPRPIEQVVTAILAASSVADILDILKMSSPEDSLDVL